MVQRDWPHQAEADRGRNGECRDLDRQAEINNTERRRCRGDGSQSEC
ncbi:MAG TPA: hypothetical protein VLW50_24900 [Streptosporangiaceae bacterium]|nr:hypothetical protein [Streptosporangiaceae bacterium]